jgi:hypothetical protein
VLRRGAVGCKITQAKWLGQAGQPGQLGQTGQGRVLGGGLDSLDSLDRGILGGVGGFKKVEGGGARSKLAWTIPVVRAVRPIVQLHLSRFVQACVWTVQAAIGFF